MVSGVFNSQAHLFSLITRSPWTRSLIGIGYNIGALDTYRKNPELVCFKFRRLQLQKLRGDGYSDKEILVLVRNTSVFILDSSTSIMFVFDDILIDCCNLLFKIYYRKFLCF